MHLRLIQDRELQDLQKEFHERRFNMSIHDKDPYLLRTPDVLIEYEAMSDEGHPDIPPERLHNDLRSWARLEQLKAKRRGRS